MEPTSSQTNPDLEEEKELKEYQENLKSKDEIVTKNVLSKYYPQYNPFTVPITYVPHHSRVQQDVKYERYVMETEERIAYQIGKWKWCLLCRFVVVFFFFLRVDSVGWIGYVGVVVGFIFFFVVIF